MADTIYRSVKLILQNSTNENLTVQGIALMSGQWDPKAAPFQGQFVADQSAMSWTAQSTELTVGVSGFIRLGGPAGYFSIAFSRPWTGPFSCMVDTEGNRMEFSQSEDLAMPDHPSVLTVMGLRNIGFSRTHVETEVFEETDVTVAAPPRSAKSK